MKKQSSRKSPRITRSHVRALIPLDTEKIRRSELGKFKRSQTTHSTLTAQLDQFEKEDVPAFRKWMHSHCGDLREKISAAYNECSTLQHTLLLAEELCDFYYPDRTRKECADAAVAFSKNNGEIPKGFEEFFEPEPVPEPDDGPFGFFEEDDEESEEARKFFESLLGDFSDAFGRPFHELPRFQHTAHQKANTAKKLYRSITKKLHPDRVGNTTPEQQELWHAAKRAYELDDVATLEHIEAHCELLNPHHNRLAAVSTIRSGILFYKKANTQIHG